MSVNRERQLKRADPSTIQDKFLVGYQGWFTCAGDGPPVHKGHHGWIHWFNKPLPDGGRPNTDLWPDTSEYSPSELYPAPGLTMEDDQAAFLFSSRHPRTVQRHFHWMARHGVDGAFLQRFAGQCEVDGRTEGGNVDMMRLRDEVGDRVKEAAEKEGRVFAIMYDVSGVPGDRIEKVIKVDWAHLIHDKAILDSPNYLRENGRPVIALWGFGFAGRGHDPAVVRSIIRHLRATTPGGAYILAGAPTHWQTLKGDADPNPAFSDIWYHEFDAISPWTVGRYHDIDGANRFVKEKIHKDIEALKTHADRRKVDYIPVIFPGSSGENLSEGKWTFNGAPRLGGKFLWTQIANVKREGVRIIYGAMWDEYDEGTAYLPVVSSKHQLPKPGHFLSLDEDGYELPSDWYMRICGLAAERLHERRPVQEKLPVKELQDYWSSRPIYEDSTSSAGPSFDPWTQPNKEETEDIPPPPYAPDATEAEAPFGALNAPPILPSSTRPGMQPLTSPPNSPSARSGSIDKVSPDMYAEPPLVRHATRPSGKHNAGPSSSRPPPPSLPPRRPTDEENEASISFPGVPGPSSVEFTSDGTAGFVRPSLGLSSPPGPWSVAQWPPPEWGTQDNVMPQPSYDVYQSSRRRPPPSPSQSQYPSSSSSSHHHHEASSGHGSHYRPHYIPPHQDFGSSPSFGSPAHLSMPGPPPSLPGNSPSASTFPPSPPHSTRPHANPPPIPPRPFPTTNAAAYGPTSVQAHQSGSNPGTNPDPVDKLVESLSKTGSKLYNKFMR